MPVPGACCSGPVSWGSAVPQGGQVCSAWEAFQSPGTQDNRGCRAGAGDRASLWFQRGFFLLLRANDTRGQRLGLAVGGSGCGQRREVS